MKSLAFSLLLGVSSLAGFCQPASPGNVVVNPPSGTGNTSHTVTWTDLSANETSFVIYRSIGQEPFVPIGSVNANQTTFTNSGLNTANVYRYAVAAAIGTLESDLWYQQGIASTPSSCGTTFCYPEACTGNYPINLDYIKTIEADCSNCQVSIAFNRFQLENLDDKVYVYDGNSTAAPLLKTFDTDHLPNGSVVASGRKITVRFKTDNFANNGLGWSITTSCQTRPASPTNLALKEVYSSMAELSWNDTNDDETGYEITINKPAPFENQSTLIVPANTTHHLFTTLDSVTTYHFKVRALKDKLVSLQSAGVSATTLGTPFRQRVVEGEGMSTNGDFIKVADLNSDKLPDLVALAGGNGTYRFDIYQSTALNQFTILTVRRYRFISQFELIDIDHDKDIDIVFVEEGYGINALINENNTYVEKTLVEAGSHQYLLIADYNNDGYEDFFTYQYTEHGFGAWYTNNRNGEFALNSDSRINLKISIALAVDVNNDGRVDLRLQADGTNMGSYTNRGPLANYRFEIDPAYFIDAQPVSIPGDFDNDGDRDYVSFAYGILTLYRNNNGTFQIEHQQLNDSPGPTSGRASDLDGDGDLDILCEASGGLYLLINAGTRFTTITNFYFEKNRPTRLIEVMDWDGDGRPDAIASNSGNALNVSVWINALSVPNASPLPPQSPSSTVDGSSVKLQWQQPADDHTTHLQYNYFVGKTASTEEVHSSMSHRDNGLTKVPGKTLTTRTDITLSDLEDGSYTWGVQAIDASGKESLFATGTFQVANSAHIRPPSGLRLENYSPYELDLTWVDNSSNETGFVVIRLNATPTGFQVIATLPPNTTTFRDSGLENSTIYSYRVYAISGGTKSFITPVVSKSTLALFTRRVSQEVTFTPDMKPASWGDISWMDFNNDNKLDLSITTSASSNASSPAFSVMEVYTQSLTNPWQFNKLTSSLNSEGYITNCSNMQWQDFDRDGDLDVALTGMVPGRPAGERHFVVMKNDGNFNFTQTIIDYYYSNDPTTLNWGDYDNDGDPDVLVSVGQQTKVYFNNNGPNVEFGLHQNLPYGGYSQWTDFDNDGDLDIAISTIPYGIYASGFAIYENNGADFILKDSFEHYSVSGLGGSLISVIDADKDGDEDYVTQTGLIENDLVNNQFIKRNVDNSASSTNKIWVDYNNDNVPDFFNELVGPDFYLEAYKATAGGASYSRENPNIGGVSMTSGVEFADIDGDTDLDYITPTFKIETLPLNWSVMENRGKVVRQTPLPPSSLTAAVNNHKVLLSWSPIDVQKNLTYNVRVGTAPGKQDYLTSLSDPATGFHRTNRIGNARYVSQKTVDKLPDGVYFWSVQSVDLAFHGSVFAAEQSFVIGSPELTTAQIASANAISHTQIKVTFANVPTGAETILYSSKDGLAFTEYTTTLQSEVTFTSEPNTTYYFRIIHRKNERYSQYSTVVQATTPAGPSIAGMQPIQAEEDVPFEITTGTFNVQNAPGYPTGYTLLIEAGQHYTIDGNKVIPAPNFNGVITIPVRLKKDIYVSNGFQAQVTIAAVDDPIESFELRSPDDGTATRNPTMLFTWDPATDIDGPGTITYTLELSKANTPAVVLNLLAGTSYELQLMGTLQKNVDYQWRVTASNPAGSRSTSWRTIRYVDTKPRIVSSAAINVKQETKFTINLNTLTVENAPGYPQGYAMVVLPGDNYRIDGGSIIANAQPKDQAISISVKIFNATDESDIFQVPVQTTQAYNAPLPFALLAPQTGSFISSNTTFSWGAAVDPDNDPLKYTIRFSWPGGEKSVHDLTTTSYQFNLSEFTEVVGKVVKWRVSAEDPMKLSSESTSEFTFTVQLTGVIEFDSGNTIYPNPVEEALHIRIHDPLVRQVTIVDMKGSRLLSRDIHQPGEVIIDVAGYSAGLYVVQLVSDHGSSTIRFKKR